MYKSPIEITYGQMKMQIENDIVRAVQSYNVNVDREELIRALQYDRNQYEKGYMEGCEKCYMDAKAAAMAELVRCKDCKHYFHYGDDVYGCRSYGMMKTQPEGFCSYGERRSDG